MTKVIGLGGATVDVKHRLLGPLVAGSSNPARGERTFGGVARNVCETLARLGVPASLGTLVGDDEAGRALTAGLAAAGCGTDLIRTVAGARTAEYLAVLDPDGGLAFGIADMALFDLFAPADLDRLPVHAAEWVFADANLPADVLAALAARAEASGFRLAVDPVSVAKSARLPADLAGIDLLVLNHDEAAAMLGGADPSRTMAEALRRRGAASVVLTDGARGLHVVDAAAATDLPAEPAAVVDVTGAGDALIAGILAGLVAGRPLAEAARAAQRLAALTVASAATVRSDLAASLLDPERSPA